MKRILITILFLSTVYSYAQIAIGFTWIKADSLKAKNNTNLVLNAGPTNLIIDNAGIKYATPPLSPTANTLVPQSYVANYVSNALTTGISLTAGSGISVSGTSPNFTVTNSQPNVPVSISSGTGISVTGSYPNFTVTNTSTAVTPTITAGAGIVITGTWPNITISRATPTFNVNVSRTFGTPFTVSSTRESFVQYPVTCSATNPLVIGSSTATVFLEYSINGGASYITPISTGNSNSVTLSVTIQLTNGQTGTIGGFIPANALVRLRSVTTGTATTSLLPGWETILN